MKRTIVIILFIGILFTGCTRQNENIPETGIVTDGKYTGLIENIREISGSGSEVIFHSQTVNDTMLNYINITPAKNFSELIEYMENEIPALSGERVKITLSDSQPDPYYFVCYVSNYNADKDVVNPNAKVSDKLYYMYLSWNWVYNDQVYENVTYLKLCVNMFQSMEFWQEGMDLFKSFPNLEVLDLTEFYFKDHEEAVNMAEKLKEVLPEGCEILLDS